MKRTLVLALLAEPASCIGPRIPLSFRTTKFVSSGAGSLYRRLGPELSGLFVAACVTLLIASSGCDSGPDEGETGTVTGTVYSVGTTSPVSDVTVSVGSIVSTTGLTGEFTLERVPVGSRTLTADGTGFYPYSETIAVSTGTNTVPDIELVPVLELRGTVHGTVTARDTASPLSGVRVAVGSISEWSGSDGSYTLEGVATGPQTITASLEGFQSYSAAVIVAVVSVTHDIDLDPAPPQSVTGIVQLAGGTQPLVGVTVTIAGREAQSGSTGVYTVSEVPEGTHVLEASYSGFLPYSATVTVSGQSTVRDIALEPTAGVTVNSVSMVMVRIPAGTFTMGSNAGDMDERPPHPVTLTRDFWLGKYEVTQGEYFAVTRLRLSFFGGDDRLPVERIGKGQAKAFANALSLRESRTPCYDGSGNPVGNIYACSGYRLPTEAEWEYAARAGTTTEYSFGSDASGLGAYSWYMHNSDTGSGRSTHPVGGKMPNPWGLFDVHGNVSEWVQDTYSSSYGSSLAVTDPRGSGGLYGLIRGGAWTDAAFNLRSARRWSIPFGGDMYIGFRLVRTAQ